MADSEVHSCANPDCRIEETGKCVEGLEPEQCPQYGQAKVPAVTKQDDKVSEKEGVDQEPIETTHLPTGEKLDISGVNVLLRKSDSRIIALIGPNEVGKTTLIATLFELFQRQKLAGLAFACSNTLIAFERACHYSRAASRLPAPKTERTGRGEPLGFYHLGLGSNSSDGVINLLMGDRPGEEYDAIADDPRSSSKLIEIQRADCITVLVDGVRLIDAGARHNVISKTKMMIQGIIDGDLVSPQHRLAVVLTKYDEVDASDNKDRTVRDFDRLVKDIQRLFGDRFDSIVSMSIAASPKGPGFARGHGLEGLLSFWIDTPPAWRYAPREEIVVTRAFSRLSPIGP